ncbi:hypothetical protein ES705_30343 [subsurface metagenome]
MTQFSDGAYGDQYSRYEALDLLKNGKVRLNYARSHFTRQGVSLADSSTKGLLVGLYKHWRDTPEYLIFEGEHQHTGEKKWGAGLMSKRGNEIYRKKLRERLGFIHDLEEIHFFDFKNRSKRHKTQALFITLTYDTKIANRLEAWEGLKEPKVVQRGPHVGREYMAHKKGCLCVSCCFNRYITTLREAYGRVSVIRSWEAFGNGYPHVHMVLMFHDHEFEAFFHNGVWRIQGKKGGSLEAYNGGFTDVEALASLRGGIKYVTKYLFKIHRALGGGGQDPLEEEAPMINFFEASTHGDFTMALMWLFRKRAFSISGDFVEFIRTLSNSKLGEDPRRGQVDLMGDPVWVWSLRGFHTGKLPCACPEIGVPWSVRLNLMQVREVMASVGYSERVDSFGPREDW